MCVGGMHRRAVQSGGVGVRRRNPCRELHHMTALPSPPTISPNLVILWVYNNLDVPVFDGLLPTTAGSRTS